MKINAKIYKQLTNEPFEVQEIKGTKIAFHYMDETPFLSQFAGRGRFAIWTSDGTDYKVLIESTYYEALKPFYSYDVNVIWLGFLEKISKISKKTNTWFIIPTLGLYAIGAAIALIWFQEQSLGILLGLVALVFISNMIQGRIVNNKVKQENQKTQDQIRDYLGHQQFDELVNAQEAHYKTYFKFDEDPEVEQDQDMNEVEVENDGK